MACRAVESWTLTSLVGAYLDLTLAYLFLLGATIAFFVSKLLSLVGLSLPCSCDGRFAHPFCAQTSLLLDFPSTNIAAVQRSLRSRFPYDSLIPAGASHSPRCCCAVQYPSEDCDLPPLPPPPPDSPEEPLVHPDPGFSISNVEKCCSTSAEMFSGGPWDSDEEGLREETATREKDSCIGDRGLMGCDKGVILKMSSLERELEEERQALAALYLELEKERSAAASAADEAMAMILRLQKEKAEIGMEARQYQRMVEEKSAYDEEEMEILKEIIVRREREKHVLEKEVEMYKEMLNSGERFEQEFDAGENFLEEKLDTLVDFSDDPMLMLQQIYKSFGKMEESSDFGPRSSPIMNSSVALQNFLGVRKNAKLFNSNDNCDQEFQEKTILATHSNSSSSNIQNNPSVADSLLNNLNSTFETEYHKDIIVKDVSDQRCDESFLAEAESNILDVHVIDDDQFLQPEEDDNQNISAAEEDSSCENFNEMEQNIRRSCSEITNRISLIDSLSGRASCSNLRSLLPSAESERYKIENEVDVLRKRLDIIRKGRENLSLYVDQKEKETFQLQLLDEIEFQLKEIKKVTKPAKNLRRASLPPQSSKLKGHRNVEI
ncbi:myosin-binding protein 2-like [Phalaenopsis equestris]|uniref:myosin-binding protein 2-like n=1 Tax=Phalaenopsis equestris TaxID=78828 RepID=UPI0009E18C32|nr:myosin-binding protein 2-like [Phalaenopsis equestris]